jgi:NAD(P)-dependent dehydrogenase (short-subunit alcohol dehydrogenase family)
MAVPHSTTEDGYEVQFGVNHMGHALLTKQLLPLLLKTAEKPDSDVRIINVSSAAANLGPGAKLPFKSMADPHKEYHPYRLYGQSKLANVLHAQELAARYPTITVVPIHPGRVGTGLLDGFLATSPYHPWALFQKAYDLSAGTLTPEEGAYNSLWAAMVPKNMIKTGQFYSPVGKESKVRNSEAGKLDKELWDWQEKEFASKGFA